MTRFSISLIFTLALVIMAGCSDGGPSSPPLSGVDTGQHHGDYASTGLETGYATLADGLSISPYYNQFSNGHELIGLWTVRLWDDGTYEVLPNRTEQIHFDITDMVLNSPNAFKITIGPPPGPNIFDINVQLTNPTGITGCDVTGVVLASGDITFHNPDSYTYLFSTPGDTEPNPYAAWDTGVGNREFQGYAAHTEMLRFEKGGITKFGEIDFVFQASFPGNQEEPYGIWGMLAGTELQSNGSNATDLRCRVGDWQANIDSVTIDLTPLGGAPNTPMYNLTENIYEVQGVGYVPTGQGVGTHNLLITATSAGVSTYNYLPVTVVLSGPITQGPFEIIYQNLPLGESDGPTDGMDIAVMGADDDTSVSMVFGWDDTYHFWDTGYEDGSFGLYYQSSGDPVTPFSMPNWRFDFADTDLADTSTDSVFSLSWGEANSSTEVLDSETIPPVLARERITVWNLNGGSLKLTANVLVIGSDPGPPQTFQVIVRPIEFASGFRQDGLVYMAVAFDAGDEGQFPVVDIMALKPPLDWQDNPNLVTGGYEIPLDEGEGADVVDRESVVGIDVDDSNILPITGGYAGHAWVAVVEAGTQNTLEIIDADVSSQDFTFVQVPLPSAPLDVEILPVQTIGGGTQNYVCVLSADNQIRLYDYAGNLAGTAGGTPYMIGTALRMDIDDKGLAVHVLHQGTSGPLVTVYKWNG
jgi:hypothetical protein